MKNGECPTKKPNQMKLRRGRKCNSGSSSMHTKNGCYGNSSNKGISERKETTTKSNMNLAAEQRVVDIKGCRWQQQQMREKGLYMNRVQATTIARPLRRSNVDIGDDLFRRPDHPTA